MIIDATKVILAHGKSMWIGKPMNMTLFGSMVLECLRRSKGEWNDFYEEQNDPSENK